MYICAYVSVCVRACMRACVCVVRARMYRRTSGVARESTARISSAGQSDVIYAMEGDDYGNRLVHSCMFAAENVPGLCHIEFAARARGTTSGARKIPRNFPFLIRRT